MTMPSIEEIRERCNKATPGPWVYEYCSYPDEEAYRIGNCDYVLGKNVWTERDAAFIAHAREDIPALLDHIVAQEASLAKAERERDTAVNDLKVLGGCEHCVHRETPQAEIPCNICLFFDNLPEYKWRGVPERMEVKHDQG